MPSTGEYLAGVAFLCLVGGLCAVGATVAVRRALPGAPRAPRALAVFLLVSGGLTFAHLVPAALGVLSRPAVAGAALLVALAGALTPRCEPASPAEPAEPPARESLALAAVGVLAAAGGAVAALAAYGDEAIRAVDAANIHLPMVARYLQEGSIHILVQYTPEVSNATYPQNGTMLLLASVLPWDSTFAVRFVNVPCLLAAATAVYLCARELGAPAGAAALSAAAVTALPAVNDPGLVQAQVDTPMLAWFAVGGLFLLRAARSGSRAELALAGIGLGLAFGTKWYAVAYVPVLVALWAVARRGRGLLLLGASIALCGGAWLARNWLLTGNPVHPAPVRILGMTVFDAPPDRLRDFAGFTVADYLLDADVDVLRDHFIPAWKANFGLLGPVLVATAGVAAIAALRSPHDRRAATVVAAAIAMGLLYTILPDTAFGPPGNPVLVGANARYLVPALLAAAVCAAWLAGRHPRARLAIEAIMLVAILEGVARSYGSLAPVIPAAGALVLGGAVLARRRPRAAAAVGAVALLGGGLIAARTVDPAEYARLDEAVARVQTSVPPGGRVAIGGTWAPNRLSPVLPSFGPRLRNRVDYLGTFVRGTLQRHADREAFVRQLREGAYDAVVIGRGHPPHPEGELPEAAWAESAGYRRAAASESLVLLLP